LFCELKKTRRRFYDRGR